jgi:hypothetical protein
MISTSWLVFDCAKLSDVLYLNSNLMLAEAYSEDLAKRGVLLEFTQGSKLLEEAYSENLPIRGIPPLESTQGSKLRGISTETTVFGQDRLFQNKPNPFGKSTQIEFELGEACLAELRVYDASGRLLWEDRAYRQAGRHSVTYRNAEGQASGGILYYTLRTPSATLTQKMVMVRED